MENKTKNDDKETRKKLTKALFKIEKMKPSAPYVNKDMYEDKQ